MPPLIAIVTHGAAESDAEVVPTFADQQATAVLGSGPNLSAVAAAAAAAAAAVVAAEHNAMAHFA